MMTYASFVWWPKTEQRKAQAALSRVQRLAMSSITGCRKTTPTIALEALLDLPTLHSYIQKEAALASFRILEEIDPKPGDCKGHMRIFEKFKDLVDKKVVSDVMPLELVFDQTFEMNIPNREQWQDMESLMREGEKAFYTDGSRKDGRTGAGVYGPGIRAWLPMGSMATVFQAEVHALKVCAQRCSDMGNLRGKSLLIASDSLAALNAISASTFKSKQVLECRKTLNELGRSLGSRSLGNTWK
jgi:hypothetical protein